MTPFQFFKSTCKCLANCFFLFGNCSRSSWLLKGFFFLVFHTLFILMSGLCSPRIYCGWINFLTAVIFLSIHLGLTSSLHFKEMRIGTALNILVLICTVNALMEFPPVTIGIYILLHFYFYFFATDFQHNAFHSQLHLLFFIGFPRTLPTMKTRPKKSWNSIQIMWTLFFTG